MQIPVQLKPGLWGAVAGAVVMSVVGFTQLGWTSATAAEKHAQETADTAVIAALVPVCVAKARLDTAGMVKLQAEQSPYSRADIVMKAGWGSFDGKTKPSDPLARACAEKLSEAKAG